MVNFEYLVNVTCGFLLRFYIFKGERLQDDYIRLCNPRTCMIMPKKAWMTNIYVQKKSKFLQKIYTK